MTLRTRIEPGPHSKPNFRNYYLRDNDTKVCSFFIFFHIEPSLTVPDGHAMLTYAPIAIGRVVIYQGTNRFVVVVVVFVFVARGGLGPGC